MSSASNTDYLSNYLHSLSEETAATKRGPRYGLDRVISQLELEAGNTPIRIPYFREGRDQLPQPIKENEHGIDFAFLSEDRTKLRIFVLKAKKLTSRTFVDERTSSDLQRASFPDLRDSRLADVTEVIVILAYNKDDAEEGIEDYERLCSGMGTKIGDNAIRSFERWNLTTLTGLVEQHLMSPSLLPENLFRKFTYLCGQLEEFDAMSPYWRELLIPEWKAFLATVLASPSDERSMRMVPVLLIILKNHLKKDAKDEPTGGAIIGWIDLIEWAVLAVWETGKRVSEKDQKKAGDVVMDVTYKFYFDTLHTFYQENAHHLAAEDSLMIEDGLANDAASSYLAFWHLGRLGLLSMMTHELLTEIDDKEALELLEKHLGECTDWIEAFRNANPACCRPMLDIQHIEMFLVWRALGSVGKGTEIDDWLQETLTRLRLRQFKISDLPWIDFRNSWESLFESLVDIEPARPESLPSYLLLMLAEILSLSSPEEGSQLMREHIISLTRDAPENADFTAIELMGWLPPHSWFDEIISGPVQSGHGVPFHLDRDAPEQSVRNFVEATKFPDEIVAKVTGMQSIYVLACLKHQSPLPSWFWRSLFASNVEAERPSHRGSMI
ncbi:hypothetical protein SAMN02745181_1158 [Rubritalea squalenifaciens DSM 18772]|uniref:Uncharacterized protein n=1 Tax=Rubritalea squalenifaciens DSM 18772 TaxID=1123071 RepID=A0A1M6GFS4_9BACT|nr:hypothetical protein [Rubritalea squalenifaciens]SHJ08758.1 hypothetical protein SAMN02745181_1158 [Rubritalea squalenifaciens DSM 18772]